MFNRILSLALRFGLFKAPLGHAAKVYKSAQGLRTQALLGLASILAVCSFLGWLPWETTKPLIEGLVGAAVPTLLDKVHSLLPMAEQVSAKVAEEAKKGDGK